MKTRLPNLLEPNLVGKEIPMGRLDGKVAIVTGGALGIGRATCELFAREGAKVVIADINTDEGAALEAAIKNEGNDAVFFRLDVADEKAWDEVMAFTLERYGKLNVLVNNAGVSLGKTVEDTTLDEWNWLMNINSTGVFLGMRAAIAVMKDNGENCSIINRSSIDGQIAEAGLFAYCASKGAVTIMTKSAAIACGQKGYKIRINSVHPGYVHTALTEKEAADSGMTNEEYFAYVGKQHPIGYIGKPMDIAYGDVYLASDESLFVTGSELTIDGGWTAQ
jgi:3(or 17)beta-hydroxysteroid dehydrogenase